MTAEAQKSNSLLAASILLVALIVGAAVYLAIVSSTTEANSIIIEPASTSIATTSCTYTGVGLSTCPNLYNMTYVYSVSYDRAWGGSYQVYDSPIMSGPTAERGSFSGQGPSHVSVSFVLYTTGYSVCLSVQKLDASGDRLTVNLGGSGGDTNSTSRPFGEVRVCLILN